jgi:hypothetical protein
MCEDDDYEDELIRQFEEGADLDDDENDVDEEQERLYREFMKKEKGLPIDVDEDHDDDRFYEDHNSVAYKRK